MARNDENDMSGDAARAGEREASRQARSRALGEENAPSASEIGDAVAKALARAAAQPVSMQKLGPIVRASVRCGYEDVRQEKPEGGFRIATVAKSVTFNADETADGKTHTVVHGRPIHLKRDAFVRRRDMGHVLIAE